MSGFKLWKAAGGGGGGGVPAPETATLTFDYGTTWKHEEVVDPVIRLETGGSTHRPAAPVYEFTVAAADLPAVTGAPAVLDFPMHPIVMLSMKRAADGFGFSALYALVSINGVDGPVVNLGSGSADTFYTSMIPVRRVVAGDVVRVFLWSSLTGSVIDLDVRGRITTMTRFPKANDGNIYAVEKPSLWTVAAPTTLPTVAPAAGGTWTWATAATWYFLSRNETGNGVTSFRPLEVTGTLEDKTIFRPNILDVSSEYGNLRYHASNREMHTHRWMSAITFRYFQLHADFA